MEVRKWNLAAKHDGLWILIPKPSTPLPTKLPGGSWWCGYYDYWAQNGGLHASRGGVEGTSQRARRSGDLEAVPRAKARRLMVDLDRFGEDVSRH